MSEAGSWWTAWSDPGPRDLMIPMTRHCFDRGLWVNLVANQEPTPSRMHLDSSRLHFRPPYRSIWDSLGSV